MHPKRHICTLLFMASLSQAQSFVFKPKGGIQVSQLNLGSSGSQKQPYLDLADPVFLIENNNTQAANNFFFNTSGTRSVISKHNIDGAFITQAMLGLQLSFATEPARPFDSISYSPVMNIYGLLEDRQVQSIQADRFVISPLTTVGADIGLELAQNGSHLQIGLGGQLYRCDYQTGLLFSAMATVRSTSVDPVDTTSLQASNKSPYKASVDPFILPYLYSEVNTEIGDLLSVFVKLNYGLSVSPKFKNTDISLEMFSRDPDGYAANSEWSMHSASLGLKIRFEDLF